MFREPHAEIMFDLSDISGIVGGLLYVAIVIIVLNYLSVMFPATSGRLTMLAIGMTLIAPGAGLALKLVE